MMGFQTKKGPNKLATVAHTGLTPDDTVYTGKCLTGLTSGPTGLRKLIAPAEIRRYPMSILALLGFRAAVTSRTGTSSTSSVLTVSANPGPYNTL